MSIALAYYNSEIIQIEKKTKYTETPRLMIDKQLTIYLKAQEMRSVERV